MAGKMLTDRGIAALKPGEWAFDPAPRGAGQLQVRKLAGGDLTFYFRYTGPGEKRDRLVIGTGFTLAAARQEASKLSRRYQAGDRDLRAVLDAERREAQRMADAAAAAVASSAANTLGALINGYIAMLEARGASSARLVNGALIRHVKTAWPILWETPAADVTTRDLLAVVARVVDLGKLREAAKLRSYLRAAYAASIRAQQSANGFAALRVLDIAHNPAADLVTIEGASTPGDRALSVTELRAYWRRIVELPGAPGAALRFHLLTGGQRVVQLARATSTDLDIDTSTVRLMDRKGRRKVPRMHDVPLIGAAVDALAIMHNMPGETDLDKIRAGAGEYLLSLTMGVTPISYESLRDWVVIVRAAMVEAGELPGGPFTVGDLRRTVETRLAGAKISQADRGQLQSHGLGGVQSRHYDRYEYLSEKRAALEALHHLVAGTTAKVTPIRRKRPAA
jgi:hypothetical protein